MEPVSLTLIELGVSATAAIASSAVLGWWWRGRSQSTRRAVLDELWTRKLRSMEVALEESENHRTREGTGLRLLQAELESTRDALTSAKQAYRDAAEEIAELKEALERRALDVRALDQAGAEMAERRKHALAELEKERERSAKLAAKVKRLAPLQARLAEREEELARLDRKQAAELDSRDAEVRRMTDWIAELSSLPDALKSREADVRELRERLRAEVAKGEERAAEAHEQLAVLDAEKLALLQQDAELKSALAKQAAELEQLRAEHGSLLGRSKELASRVDQLEDSAAAVDARIERERQSFEDIAVAERDQASSERERLARRLVEREEELRNALRAASAARAESEGARVELRSLQRRVEELNRADARRGDAPSASASKRSSKPQAVESVDEPTPTANSDSEAPQRKRRRRPTDELALAVGEAKAAPSLFAEPSDADSRVAEAPNGEAAHAAPETTAIEESAAEVDPYTAAVEAAVQAQAELEAEESASEEAQPQAPAAVVDESDEDVDVTADASAVPEDDASVQSPEADAAESVIEDAAELPEADTLELATDSAAERAELVEDEPEVVLKPHRAAPPSLPAFPGLDDTPKSAPKTKRGKRKSPAAQANPAQAEAAESAKAPVLSGDQPALDDAAPGGKSVKQSVKSRAQSQQPIVADDFTRIRGIGPRTANKIVAAGITSFADFADLTGDALDEIAETIGVGAAKIKSSGWQRSARRLAKSRR